MTENSLKRRDPLQQQPPTPTSDEENQSSSGDILSSPCKRLRLQDSPASPQTLTDQTNLQDPVHVHIQHSLDQDRLYNTPEKHRLDAGYSQVSINPAVSILEKSEFQADLTEEYPSAMSSLPELKDLLGDQSGEKVSYCQAEPPRDKILLCTPVKTLTYEEDEDDVSIIAPTPIHSMPCNTPERSVILEGEDSELEEIFINQISTEDEHCEFIPNTATSITFADRTNVDGVCQGTTQQDVEELVSEQSLTFADQTNVNGARRVVEPPSQTSTQPNPQETRRDYDVPRPRIFSQPESVGVQNPHRPHPGDLMVQAPHPQRHRFSSVGNLCSEELDHHRLSLQSYGSLPRFAHQQRGMVHQRGYSEQQGGPVGNNQFLHPQNPHPQVLARSSSYRSSFQPQSSHHRFNTAQPLPAHIQERYVDYGSVDGLVGVGKTVDHVQQGQLVDYGSVDAPMGRTHQERSSGHYGPGPRTAADSQNSQKLWFYGSIDHPQRLTSSVQALNLAGDPGPMGHCQPPFYASNSQSQGSLLGHSNEQPFVRSASRKTLPRLGSQRTESRQDQLVGHDKGHSLGGHRATEERQFSSRPLLDQVQEVPETSTCVSEEDGHHPSNKCSKGSLCVIPGPENLALNPHNSVPQITNHGHIMHPHFHHPAYPGPLPGTTRMSGSSGSHAEILSQGSAGRADSHRHSDHSGDPHQHRHQFSGSQGSVGSQGRSVGSQPSAESHRSWGSHRSGGSQSDNQGQSGETEGCPPHLALPEGSKKRRVLESPGQVKVSAYLNCGLVTVHVVEGRYFACSWKAMCDSYIKLSLIPEDTGRKLRLKSKPVLNSNSPVYDEKFSLELQKSDENKRLLVSIWHKDLQSGCSEFLGCMSFGVKGILRNKDVSGWYYLLTEDVGKKKHLQVSARAKAIVKPRSSHSIPQINRDVYGLESVTIRIERGKNGFGFTVVDEFPVRVGRVDLASPAEEAGLKPGDFVIKVNNQNVSRSTVNSVAKLVKKSGQILLLNVNRCHSTAGPDDSMESNAPYEKSDWRRADHIYESIADGTVGEKPDFVDDTENKENEMTMDTRFEISSVCEPFTRDKVSASTPLVPLDSKRVGLMGKGVAAEDQKKLEAIHRLMSLELDFIDFMQLGIQRYSRPLRHRIFNVVQHNAVFQNIEKLVNISEYHVQQMQENAPSIYPESDDDSQSSEDRHFASAVAMIYYSKAHMFCQAHETYASGLSEANRVLSEMRQNEEFLHFVKHPPLEPGQPSISAFIFRPLQHIKELSSVFQEIYIHTASSSIDHATLKQVTHVLQESVHTISNMSNARVQSLTSLSSHTKSSSGKGSYTASSAASSKADSGSESGRVRKATDSLRTSASLQTVRVMDREVMKMQDRLVFSQNVPVFQLCHEDRHIIYQGDVFFLHNSHWSKIQMTLFSDMVMLCQPDKDGSLHVLCDPLYLHDICHIDTTNTHATELVLSTCPTSPYTGVPSTQSLVFRTPSPEDLSTWKTLLEHRVKKAQDHRAQESQNLSKLPPTPPTE